MATLFDTSHRSRSFASGPAQVSAEVIVVGAGLGGLNAALELQRAGVSCLVLDARDRLGDCMASGAWIDDLHHPRAWNLARSLDVDVVEEKLKAGKSII